MTRTSAWRWPLVLLAICAATAGDKHEPRVIDEIRTRRLVVTTGGADVARLAGGELVFLRRDGRQGRLAIAGPALVDHPAIVFYGGPANPEETAPIRIRLEQSQRPFVWLRPKRSTMRFDSAYLFTRVWGLRRPGGSQGMQVGVHLGRFYRQGVWKARPVDEADLARED